MGVPETPHCGPAKRCRGATASQAGSVSAEYVMIASAIAGTLLLIATALGGRIEALYTIP